MKHLKNTKFLSVCESMLRVTRVLDGFEQSERYYAVKRFSAKTTFNLVKPAKSEIH